MRRVVIVLAVAAFAVSSFAAARTRPSRSGPNLDRVAIEGFHPLALRPGDSYRFRVIEFVGTGPFAYVPVEGASVRWSIQPRWYGTIDQAGLLTVSKDVAGDVTMRVYASFNGGDFIISTPVYIRSGGNDPLFDGRQWTQSGEIPCDGSPDLPVTGGIRELRFHPDRTFSVTWVPFELRTDFFGLYSIRPATSSITFAITGSNSEPSDFDGVGTYEIVPLGAPEPSGSLTVQRAKLRLTGVNLGTQPGKVPTPRCGMVFEGTLILP